MSNRMKDYVIIGAGLTGLSLSWDLSLHFEGLQIQLLEKSKSCGGRMATRRVNEKKFDHGAQSIKRSPESEKWIQLWKNQQVAQPFPADSVDGICGFSGITMLAKTLAQELNIIYNFKVTKITSVQGSWEISDDDGSKMRAKNAILTCPLPQSLEILEKSKLIFDSKLSQIQYEKALVLLVESDQDFDPALIYQEEFSNEIFSICAQHRKGNSDTPAWTIVMNSEWSSRQFDQPEDIILKMACEKIQDQLPGIRIRNASLKKWKYCKPDQTWNSLFYSPFSGLYLAGDAFGGGSLTGALRSSMALLEELKSKS